MKLGAEHDAVKPVDDLRVGEGCALGGAAFVDFGMLGPCIRRPESRCDQNRQHYGEQAAQHRGRRRNVPVRTRHHAGYSARDPRPRVVSSFCGVTKHKS
jgi:hypothetical protein